MGDETPYSRLQPESFGSKLDRETVDWAPDKEVWNLLTESRHGEFILNGKPRKYVFMTDDDARNQVEIQRVLSAWNLKSPNLIVQLNGHNTTFNNFVTQEMCNDQESFLELKEKLKIKETLGDAGKSELNIHLYNRIMNMYSNLAVACDMTNCWFFSSDMPLCNWMMLTEALEMSKARPTVLAAHDVASYTSNYYPPTNKLCREMFFDLFLASVPLKDKPDKHRPRHYLQRSQFDMEAENMVSKKHEWYATASKSLKEAVMPYSAARQPNWWLFPEREEGMAVEEEKLKFQFMAPNLAATHFIFTPGKKSLDPAHLGNAGWVLVGGGWYGKGFELRQAMMQGDPAILVDNTGSETQQYARLIRRVLELQSQGVPRLDIQGQAQDVLEFARKGTASIPVSRFGGEQLNVPEVMRIIDMVYERPGYFQETLVTVNVLTDTAESVVNKAARSFASRATHGFELGAGNADQAAVLQAWRIHQALSTNAARLFARDSCMMTLAATFTFLGTCSAIAKMSIEEFEYTGGDPAYETISSIVQFLITWGAVIFPAFASIFTGVVTALRYNSKAASLTIAASKVVAELYNFRMRTCGYEVMAIGAKTVNDEESKDAETVEQNTSVLLHRSRARFATIIRAMVEDISRGSAAEADLVYQSPLQESDLAQYVDNACYNGKGFIKSADVQQTMLTQPLLGGSKPLAAPLLIEAWNVEHVGNMTSTSYFHTRTLPVLELFKVRAPRLGRWDVLIQVSLILFSTLATVLAAVNLNMWVPLLFAATALLKTISEHQNFHRHRVAMVKATSTLLSLETWWASLAGVDKGLPATRDELVNITESVVLDVISASVGAVISRPQPRNNTSGETSTGEEANQHDED